MREIPSSVHYLELLLHEMKTNNPLFSDRTFGAIDLENVGRLSQLFLKLLTKSNLPQESLDIILPGGNYYEIIGMLLATKAYGLSEIQMTSIEKSRIQFDFTRDRMGEFVGQQLRGTDIQIIRGRERVSLRLGDAERVEKMPQMDSAGIMVFMGNAPAFYFAPIFSRWATVGKEKEKPFLFVATSLAEEKRAIKRLLKQAKRQGDLKSLSGMDNVKNPHAFKNISFRGPFFSHAHVFAAVRR